MQRNLHVRFGKGQLREILYLSWLSISLLSQGAIVSLFGGFYYWIGKISGYQYSEKWGLVHVMVFTIAVNLVFMPMHFLGLAGMPRRIPDYPDGYLGWNSFITLGSFLTFFSLVLFLWIVAAVIFNPNKDKVNNNLLSRWVH